MSNDTSPQLSKTLLTMSRNGAWEMMFFLNLPNVIDECVFPSKYEPPYRFHIEWCTTQHSFTPEIVRSYNPGWSEVELARGKHCVQSLSKIIHSLHLKKCKTPIETWWQYSVATSDQYLSMHVQFGILHWRGLKLTKLNLYKREPFGSSWVETTQGTMKLLKCANFRHSIVGEIHSLKTLAWKCYTLSSIDTYSHPLRPVLVIDSWGICLDYVP